MASTTAMFTGLTGLATNARWLDVTGNNIANVNTQAYKSNRMLFASSMSRNIALGTAPGATTGGTNPKQIGLGSRIWGTQRDFSNGAISVTGVPTDVAIEGDGFFVIDLGGEQLYTRAGAFQMNELQQLVTIDGGRLMGYAVDDQFQIVEGGMTELTAPLGTLTVAEATRNVAFKGSLNASGIAATTGSIHESRAFYTDAGLTTLLADPNIDLTVAGNDLYIDDGAGGSFLAFEGGAGTILTLGGVEKAGQDLGTRSFAFSATPVVGEDASGQTLQDFMNFLQGFLGLDDSMIGDQSLGGSVSFGAGMITITGNEGTAQDLRIDTADMVATSVGAAINQPLVFQKAGDADGESVRTSFVAYDSLGTPLTVDLTFVLQEAVDGVGTTWTFVAESGDSDGPTRVVGLGTVDFDVNGTMVDATNRTIGVQRGNGAVNPLSIELGFEAPDNSVRALTSTGSSLAAVYQDGAPIGTLSGFSIGEDGIITGAFDSGLTRQLGQIALAQFVNNEGLVDVGSNNYRVGANSGDPQLVTPLSFGTGRLLGGALELSNVDLSQEFINMIMASTGYSAASRIISTTDELLDQLLILGR